MKNSEADAEVAGIVCPKPMHHQMMAASVKEVSVADSHQQQQRQYQQNNTDVDIFN